MPPTSGFTLSALPRSPTVPNNLGQIGEIDARGIYDAVRGGLDTATQAAQAPQKMLLANVSNQLAQEQAQSQRSLLPLQTQAEAEAIPERSTILAETAKAAPFRTALAQTGAESSAATLEATRAQHQRETIWRQQAANELPIVEQKLKAANQLADYDQQAADLAQIQIEHPWVYQLPETKTLAATIESNRLHAQQEAGRLAERRLQEEGMQKRAEILAGSRVAVAGLPRTGTAAVLRQHADNLDALNAAKAALAETPDDPEMQAAVVAAQAKVDATQGAVNAFSSSVTKDQIPAKVSPPAGLVLLQSRQKAQAAADAAQQTLNAALADGDPDTIAAAQADFNRASALLKDAETEHQLYHAERTKKISKGIDAAAISELASKIAGGKTTPAAKPATAAPTADKFVAGQTYTDAKGNKAKYLGNGQWQEIPK